MDRLLSRKAEEAAAGAAGGSHKRRRRLEAQAPVAYKVIKREADGQEVRR